MQDKNFKISRVVNIAVLVLLLMVSAILFEYWRKYQPYFSNAVSIWVSVIICYLFLGYSIPILLSSGAPVKFVNNNITVIERVKTRTVILHLKYIAYCYSAYSLRVVNEPCHLTCRCISVQNFCIYRG